MKPKIIALVQARTDSTRLPNKVLKKIIGKPMIIHQLIRTSQSKYIQMILLVTSNNKSDDELVKTVQTNGFDVYRGDKNNVLKRFCDALDFLNVTENDIVVRLTGDCPLHDADIIDEAIESYINSGCDYLANCVHPIYPDGFDVEVTRVSFLQRALQYATKKSQLEHVTPYIRDCENFNIKHLEKEPQYCHWRLTVDEAADFALVKRIYEHFNCSLFNFDQIVSYLDTHQDLLLINNSIQRNEGYKNSLRKDHDT